MRAPRFDTKTGEQVCIMTIGVLEMDFVIPGARSLKEKRRVVKSLKDQLRNRYNCSVAETDFMDIWTRARIVACVVSGDSRHANEQVNEIARFSSMKNGAEMLDYRIHMM